MALKICGPPALQSGSVIKEGLFIQRRAGTIPKALLYRRFFYIFDCQAA